MKGPNFIIVLLGISLSGALFARSDIEIVKQRVVAELLDQTVDDVEVSELVESIGEDGRWPDINYEDVSRTGFENRYHLRKLKLLSLAYRKKSSSFYRSRKVLEKVNRSLEFWCDHDFISENWYHNQVSTPSILINVLLLMDDHIKADLKTKALQIIGRAHLNAPGARPGGDRIKFGGIAAKRGLVVCDEDSFAEIMRERDLNGYFQNCRIKHGEINILSISWSACINCCLPE